jgi:hypothetical protein
MQQSIQPTVQQFYSTYSLTTPFNLQFNNPIQPTMQQSYSTYSATILFNLQCNNPIQPTVQQSYSITVQQLYSTFSSAICSAYSGNKRDSHTRDRQTRKKKKKTDTRGTASSIRPLAGLSSATTQATRRPSAATQATRRTVQCNNTGHTQDSPVQQAYSSQQSPGCCGHTRDSPSSGLRHQPVIHLGYRSYWPQFMCARV